MAESVDFEGSNITYLGPKGTNVTDLPVFKHELGVTFCIRFTPEELAQIAESGVVWVDMQTHKIAPILLSAVPLVMMPGGRPSRPEPFMKRARVGGLVDGDA
jgi:hypothetical protein